MRSLGLVASVALLVATAGALPGGAAGRFDRRLARDKQAVHVLNRLTFGPRAGDTDAVRKVGVEQWIRRQLNPTRIPQNPLLDARLKPLETTRMASWQIIETYPSPNQFTVDRPTVTLPPDQYEKVLNGTLDDRRAVLNSLTPDVRARLLVGIGEDRLRNLPEFQAEAAKARAADQQMVQAAVRSQRPPLNDLLTRDQIALVLGPGQNEQKAALLNSLAPETRTHVLRQMPADLVPYAFQRAAMIARQPAQYVMTELIDAKLYRALYSTRQLEEVLVDFWFNHFNVHYASIGNVSMVITSFERDAIRPHVLGRFRDMLLATARHPAMLIYLDNWRSRLSPDATLESLSQLPQGTQSGRPITVAFNEHYARELMEVHTIGPGSYTQADVIDVARCFAGWATFELRYGEFQFHPDWHDRAEKVVLGHVIPRGGGESDGLKVIDILARHPSTARFISRKLAQRFVADEPPLSLVDRMADTFARTDGDLRAVLETMLLSVEFLSEGAWQAKVKSPLEMVASSLRALNADVTDTIAIARHIAELGQPLYGKPEPSGYPEISEAWAHGSSLLGRMNFAGALTAGQVPGVTVDVRALDTSNIRRAATRAFGTEPSAETIAAIREASPGERPAPETVAAVLIASPDFQKK